MPGYIIHLTEAEMILTALRKKGCSFEEDFEEEFLLGALLPDTKIKRAKVTSHFWREKDMVNLAIAPYLPAFEEKYGGMLNSPVMFGYWAHLHLDELFVRSFWPSMMTFLGENGEEEVIREKIATVFLKNQNCEIPIDTFFTSQYYYGDYDRTNQLFYDRFHLHIPKMRDGLSCPVTEVDLCDLNRVLAELDEMLHRDRTGDMELKVFSEKLLVAFLEETAEVAAERIGVLGDVQIGSGYKNEKTLALSRNCQYTKNMRTISNSFCGGIYNEETCSNR